jgi:N6-adenosine-specific RNA methylase IME4
VATARHSLKPKEFYDLVESLCPAPRYADLFSRYRHNDKWDCHGDEAPVALVDNGEAARGERMAGDAMPFDLMFPRGEHR